MSHENPTQLDDLKQEALSRMSSFELMEQAIGLVSREQNTLNIEAVELENGTTTLHTVTSSLTAGKEIHTQFGVEEGQLVRRQVMAGPATLIANVVALRSPDNAGNRGDARLYRLTESLELPMAEMHLPFRATATKAMDNDDPRHGTIRFADDTNTSYRPFLGPEEEASYFSVGDLTLLATDDTNIQLETIGTDQLDQEVGVRATLSGLAKVFLARRQFLRITDKGAFCGPGAPRMVDITIPPEMPQGQRAEYHRIPDDATVGPNAQGKLVPQGKRAESRKYEYTDLSPTIDSAQTLALIDLETIEWTECTDVVLKSLSPTFTQLMPFSPRTSYTKARELARDKIRETLLAGRQPLIGETGCLAVAACLSELRGIPGGGHKITASFFA